MSLLTNSCGYLDTLHICCRFCVWQNINLILNLRCPRYQQIFPLKIESTIISISFRFHLLLPNPVILPKQHRPIVFDSLLKQSNEIRQIFLEGESHESFISCIKKIELSVVFLLSLSHTLSHTHTQRHHQFFFLWTQTSQNKKKKKEKNFQRTHAHTHTRIGQLNKQKISR